MTEARRRGPDSPLSISTPVDCDSNDPRKQKRSGSKTERSSLVVAKRLQEKQPATSHKAMRRLTSSSPPSWRVSSPSSWPLSSRLSSLLSSWPPEVLLTAFLAVFSLDRRAGAASSGDNSPSNGNHALSDFSMRTLPCDAWIRRLFLRLVDDPSPQNARSTELCRAPC